MRKITKRFTAMALGLVMVLSLAGCGSKGEETKTSTPEATKEESSNTGTAAETENSSQSATEAESTESTEVTPGYLATAKDPVTLSWYINFSWFTTPWGENLVSKTITEETGVTVEFVVPAGNEADKLNALIASDTLPDIVTLGWWESQIGDMIDADMVYALDELADQYDPYFWEVADQNVINWYTSDDGHLYQYPNSSYSPADYDKYDTIASNETFLVRKDIYEAIGSPDMTTTDGFIAAVKKAAEMYPTVNGQELIPVGAHEFNNTGCVSFDDYLFDFLAIPYVDQSGQFYDRYTDPNFVAWLKAFRELGAEGYLKDDIFIDTRAQMEEKIAQGRYFCMIYQRTDLADQQKILFANDPNSIYMAVDGPKNLNGDDYELPGTGINGWTVSMISKNCEHPDRAIQLFSYFMSEHGQLMTWFGVEGVTYTMNENGIPVMLDEVKDLLKNDRTAYDKQYGADSCYWMFQNNAMDSAWAEAPSEPLGQMQEWTYPYTVYTGQYDVTLTADSDESVADLKIKNLWSEVLPKLLLAKSEEEFDTLLENFKAQRESLGYNLVVEASTAIIDKNMQKLGLK